MLNQRSFLTAVALLGFAALDGVLADSAGCGTPPTLTSGTQSMEVNGKTREYTLQIPEDYNESNTYKLIFGLHWLGGTMADVATGQSVGSEEWAYYGLQQLADNSAIFIAPQGIDNGWANADGEDIAFIQSMMETVEEDLCINENQRFATGFSYGGAMSYSIACSLANDFRAVAVLSGGELSGCEGGTDPIAYLGVHGIGDTVLDISEGSTMRDRFVQNNGCMPEEPPEPAAGSLEHTKTEYSNCSADHPVSWIAFDEGHIAAPQDGAPGESGTNTYVPGETWEFFSQFT